MKAQRAISCGAAAVLLMVATGQAAVYKWTDGKGEVHYTQAPPQGVGATEVEVTAPPPGANESNPTLQERLEAFEQRRVTRKESEDEQATEEQAQKIKAENCRRARANLIVLQSHGQISLKEGDTHRKLTEEERQAKISEVQGHIHEFCGRAESKQGTPH